MELDEQIIAGMKLISILLTKELSGEFSGQWLDLYTLYMSNPAFSLGSSLTKIKGLVLD